MREREIERERQKEGVIRKKSKQERQNKRDIMREKKWGMESNFRTSTWLF